MKLILITNTNERKLYKSLKEIQKDYPQYEYHQLRQVYLQSSGREHRKMHPLNQHIYKQIKIYDQWQAPALESNGLELLYSS